MTRWGDDEVATLTRMWHRGIVSKVIAKKLKRTQTSVLRKAHTEGLPNRRAAAPKPYLDVRVDLDVHQAAQRRAQAEGIRITRYINSLLRRQMGMT